jgi:hypothetical protein
MILLLHPVTNLCKIYDLGRCKIILACHQTMLNMLTCNKKGVLSELT